MSDQKCTHNIKILHVVRDEKFIDVAYRNFESVFEGCNDYLIVGRPKELKYIKKVPVIWQNKLLLFTRKFRQYLKKYNIIIFHSFACRYSHYIALMAPKSIKLVWVGWGFDYYFLIKKYPDSFLKEETLKKYKKNKPKTIIVFLKRILKNTIFKYIRSKTIDRIDFFAPVIDDEFQLIKDASPFFRATQISWNYGNSCTVCNDEINCTDVNKERNILIGNSASYTNNHLDIFQNLGSLDLSGRKIICPLNYGDDLYRKIVIDEGRSIFGDYFVPLQHWLPLKEYLEILNSCQFVIMNHLRQQGTGNISMALYQGAKVFLDSQNPLYIYYKRKGYVIFAIEDIKNEINNVLTKEEQVINRCTFENSSSINIVLEKTKQLVIKVLNSK